MRFIKCDYKSKQNYYHLEGAYYEDKDTLIVNRVENDTLFEEATTYSYLDDELIIDDIDVMEYKVISIKEIDVDEDDALRVLNELNDIIDYKHGYERLNFNDSYIEYLLSKYLEEFL